MTDARNDPMKDLRVVVANGREWLGIFNEAEGQLTQGMLCHREGISESLQHWVARRNADQLMVVGIKGDYLSRSLDDDEQKALQRYIEDMAQVKTEARSTLENHLYFRNGKM